MDFYNVITQKHPANLLTFNGLQIIGGGNLALSDDVLHSIYLFLSSYNVKSSSVFYPKNTNSRNLNHFFAYTFWACIGTRVPIHALVASYLLLSILLITAFNQVLP